MEFKFANLYEDKELLDLAYNDVKGATANFELLLDIFEYKSRLHFSKFQ
ncbi:MAG: hypothetical protein ACR5KV_01805 [Wolbachia sp.]